MDGQSPVCDAICRIGERLRLPDRHDAARHEAALQSVAVLVFRWAQLASEGRARGVHDLDRHWNHLLNLVEGIASDPSEARLKAVEIKLTEARTQAAIYGYPEYRKKGD